jgi:hypothetical protein
METKTCPVRDQRSTGSIGTVYHKECRKAGKMHRIKIQGPRRDWSGFREALVLILFFVLLAVAAFQGGYIYRDRETDELRKQVYQLDIKTREINGRLVGLETTYRSGSHGAGRGK